MNIFICWSGQKSEIVAQALYNWLECIINFVKPWMSTASINPGERWNEEISKKLSETDFGIICLTPENIDKPWILFEAGALAKSIDKGRVIPLLIGLKSADLKPPLSQFQSVSLDRNGIRTIILSINKYLETSALSESVLDTSFKSLWSEFEENIMELDKIQSTPIKPRSERELLEEILLIVRNFESPKSKDKESYKVVADQHIADFINQKPQIRSLVSEWHLYSGFPEKTTDSGYVYNTLKKQMNYGLKIKKKYEILKINDGITDKSTEYAEISRRSRAYGDFENAKNYLNKALVERENISVDILDENGKLTNKAATLKEVHKKSLLHATCHIFVILKKEYIYLQKRSFKKPISSGKWTATCGGHLRKGEDSLKAAKREIFEELGFHTLLSYKNIGKIHTYVEETKVHRCSAIAHLYSVDINEELDLNLINEQEIDEIKYFKIEELRDMINSEKTTMEFAHDFPTIFNKFLESHTLNKLNNEE